jgi:ABC-type long-subunit fatty acid transport system fused permease/ATPase subunit
MQKLLEMLKALKPAVLKLVETAKAIPLLELVPKDLRMIAAILLVAGIGTAVVLGLI